MSASRDPDESHVALLASEIARFERGLFVAGASHRSLHGMADLAAAAGWPLIAEPTSGARVDDSVVSCYEALLRNDAWARRHRPEIVVRAGSLGLSKLLLGHVAAARQVLVDPDGAWLDPDRSVDVIVPADASRLCAEVAKAVAAGGSREWLTSWSSAETAARRAIDEVLDAEPVASEPGTARDVARALPDQSTLVVASSMPVRDLDWFMLPRPGLRVIANRGANGIDGFVSTAVGAAVGSGRPTVALSGDLSLLHDQNGLLDPPAGIKLVIVVVNNDGGGIFSFLPHAEHASFDRLFRTPHGVDLGALAATHGCAYVRVEAATDVVPRVLAGLESGGLHIIEVPTDAPANVELHQRLWSAVAEVL